MFNRTAVYILADLPPLDSGNARAMAVQARFCKVRTAEELLAAIPHARPLDAGVDLTLVTHYADGPPLEPTGVYPCPAGIFRETERFA